ncbi:MAG: hypothetical protein J6J75_04130, partial [Alistipes sp.]|nr:hypothetical protein [Alistipes sp.]
YDVYADARRSIPRVKEPLQAMDGEYYLVKTDILAHTMSFSSSKDAMVNVVTIPVSRVREILSLNRAGKKVDSIVDAAEANNAVEEPTYRTEEDSITRFDKAKKRRKNRNNNNRNRDNGGNATRNGENRAAKTESPDAAGNAEKRGENQDNRNGENRSGNGNRNRNNRNNNRRRNNRPNGGSGNNGNGGGNNGGAAGNGNGGSTSSDKYTATGL